MNSKLTFLTRAVSALLRVTRPFLVVILGTLFMVPTGAQEILYRATDLGDLPFGGNVSQAYGINESAQIVGESAIDAGPGDRAFLWTSAGGMQNLGTLSAINGSRATDINDSGRVVGYSGPRAFLWDNTSGMRSLADLPGGIESNVANAINNDGQIVGSGTAATGTRAVLWSRDGTVSDLGDLPGGADSSFASDINSSGQVVGGSGASVGQHAFVWTSSGGMQDLGDLPGGIDDSVASAINDAGEVVGTGRTADGHRAFRWTTAGGMQNLGLLTGPFNSSFAHDINSHGVVVGSNLRAAGGIAFRWTPSAGMQNLNDLLDSSSRGWILNEATAINDAGEIVGWGFNPESSTHAYLLTPFSTQVFAFTGFNEPPIGAISYTSGPVAEEIGFMTTSSTSGGSNPLIGVAFVGESGARRAFAHRSINATTTFDIVDLAPYDETSVSLEMQVANTTYELGDFVRVFVTNGTDTIDLINSVANAGSDAIDDLAGNGFVRFSAFMPNEWTQATLVITSSTNSTQGAEQFDFDGIEFRGIPEPGTWGLALMALAASFFARWMRYGMNRGGHGGSRR